MVDESLGIVRAFPIQRPRIFGILAPGRTACTKGAIPERNGNAKENRAQTIFVWISSLEWKLAVRPV